MNRIKNYINGKWVESFSNDYSSVFNPFTGSIIAEIAVGSAEDVDIAVTAAQQAFQSWSMSSSKYRGQILNNIANSIEARQDEIAMLITQNNGKPLTEAVFDVADSVDAYRYYATLAQSFDDMNESEVKLSDTSYRSTLVKEAVGVVGLITPWNFPTVTTAWKLAPALAAGCSVVLKPSEITPVPEAILAEICEQAGLPPGVLNIVFGDGLHTGAAIVNHPQIAKVSFTGSTRVGQNILASSSSSLKNVSLELGGKSPIIVCKDADIDEAVQYIMAGIFFNAGQMCSATSRLIVHQDIADKIYAALKVKVATLKLGDPMLNQTDIGPLSSKAHFERVCHYLEIAHQEKLTPLIGGSTDAKQGLFVNPTIYINVPHTSTLWNEEIFGPVLCSHSFENISEAIRLANDSEFGLAATVVCKDEKLAHQIARQLHVGHIWINSEQRVFIETSWGGTKKSSIGRELGPWGLSAYTEIKHITLPN